MSDLAPSRPSLSGHPLLWPAMAAMLVIGWSSGFVGIRYANEEAGIALLLFWRTLISGLILLPFAVFFGPGLSAKAVLAQMAFGVMAVFLYLGGFALAIGQRVPTGLVALISDLLPLAIAAMSQPLLGERLTARQWLGTGIALAGVMLVSFDSLAFGAAPFWAYGLTVASMLVFALASILHRRQPILRPHRRPPPAPPRRAPKPRPAPSPPRKSPPSRAQSRAPRPPPPRRAPRPSPPSPPRRRSRCSPRAARSCPPGSRCRRSPRPTKSHPRRWPRCARSRRPR